MEYLFSGFSFSFLVFLVEHVLHEIRDFYLAVLPGVSEDFRTVFQHTVNTQGSCRMCGRSAFKSQRLCDLLYNLETAARVLHSSPHWCGGQTGCGLPEVLQKSLRGGEEKLCNLCFGYFQ